MNPKPLIWGIYATFALWFLFALALVIAAISGVLG